MSVVVCKCGDVYTLIFVAAVLLVFGYFVWGWKVQDWDKLPIGGIYYAFVNLSYALYQNKFL